MQCWQGRVAEVVVELTRHQQQVGRPPPEQELPASDVRRVVAEGLSYLSHNAARMDYPRYRRLGLPTTSSLVESLVGDFNARVKSKQKYWNRPGGAEAILQVRAAYLSEDGRLQRYFALLPRQSLPPAGRLTDGFIRKGVHGLPKPWRCRNSSAR